MGKQGQNEDNDIEKTPWPFKEGERASCGSCCRYEDGFCDIWLKYIEPDDHICMSYGRKEDD